MLIQEYINATKETVDVGTVDIDFNRGELIDGNERVFNEIKNYFTSGVSGDSIYQLLVLLGSNKKDARSGADFGMGVFSLHSQSPGYELTDPFTDKSQFKALISCMGWYANELADVEMPKSTWDDQNEEYTDGRIELLN